MEPIEGSETSAYNNTLTPGTYPKEKKLQSKHGESIKSRIKLTCLDSNQKAKNPGPNDSRNSQNLTSWYYFPES